MSEKKERSGDPSSDSIVKTPPKGKDLLHGGETFNPLFEEEHTIRDYPEGQSLPLVHPSYQGKSQTSPEPIEDADKRTDSRSSILIEWERLRAETSCEYYSDQNERTNAPSRSEPSEGFKIIESCKIHPEYSSRHGLKLQDLVAKRINDFIGEILGDHTVLEPIGSGGYGLVYKVQGREGSTLAMKIGVPNAPLHLGLTDHLSDTLKGFEKECKALSGIKSDHIPEFRHYGILPLEIELADDEGNPLKNSDGEPMEDPEGKPLKVSCELPYYTSEFIEGYTLSALIPHSFSPFFALSSGREVAKALHQAHMEGIIHRDVKPANIIRSVLGTTKLVDFGLAKPAAEDEDEYIRGTPVYMAPEQLCGRAAPASDIFSLGLVLYECFNGKVENRDVISYADLRDLTEKRLNFYPDSINPNCPELAPIMDPIFSRMLDLEPGLRASAREVEIDLETACIAAERLERPSEHFPVYINFRQLVQDKKRLNEGELTIEQFHALLATYLPDIMFFPANVFNDILRGSDRDSKAVDNVLFTDSKAGFWMGRSQDADWVLDSSAVSRKHAYVHRTDQGYKIEDKGSFNGTFLHQIDMDIRGRGPVTIQSQDWINFAGLDYYVLERRDLPSLIQIQSGTPSTPSNAFRQGMDYNSTGRYDLQGLRKKRIEALKREMDQNKS